MSDFPQDGLDRLAERVAAGEAVFFIGSGFSVDSEGNDANRLISRLLARFDALTAILKREDLRDGLKATFSVAASTGGFFTTPDQVKTLGREYYTFNDWIASAFSLLLGQIKKLAQPKREQLLASLHSQERDLLAQLAAMSNTSPVWMPLLEMKDLKALLALPAPDRGKALFLETMGFADLDVMAGRPYHQDPAEARESYGNRLRPRHRVLAWLAREGLAPVLLTTNFDLLLEGAYRTAGLVVRFPQGIDRPQGLDPEPVRGMPPATFDAFCRIASASQFFGRGDDRRAAQLLKIHGCAESYRWARESGKDALHTYLPALVFTFREIQNWREDSWSRDLVSTLLRTRTIVFCGYSTADPVLHDTIRTVYEEMADRRGKRDETSSREAPAFFLGGAGRTEFYGMEILRAASRAVGADSGLTEHPNYLRFHFLPKKGPASFPSLDEMMRWLFHLVFRRRQAQALEGDLGRVATLLLGHPCPEAERRLILKEFDILRQEEADTAGKWKDQPDDHLAFERIVGWTERFQTGLLREFALADAALRSSGPGQTMDHLRRSPWYYPALDHTDWAAWGAVVELALRRRISAWQGKLRKGPWQEDRPWLSTAAGAAHPSVLYARNRDKPTPFCLTIRLRPSGGLGQEPVVPGACRKHSVWDLDYGEIPWRRAVPEKKPGKTPDAATIWSWAYKPLAQLAGEKCDVLF
jgi:hypothetical protein